MASADLSDDEHNHDPFDALIDPGEEGKDGGYGLENLNISSSQVSGGWHLDLLSHDSTSGHSILLRLAQGRKGLGAFFSPQLKETRDQLYLRAREHANKVMSGQPALAVKMLMWSDYLRLLEGEEEQRKRCNRVFKSLSSEVSRVL